MRDYAIILAADLPTADEVLCTVKKVGPIVDGVKVGVATLLEAGKSILSRIRDVVQDSPLLVDLKIADIGFLGHGVWQGTNSKIIRGLENSGATHVTVQGFPGPVSLAEAVASAKEYGIKALLLPLMSHAGAGLFFSRPIDRSSLIAAVSRAGLEAHIPDDLPCRDITEGILLLGEALNADGYIGPATLPLDLQRFRTITRRRIWCPGFGRQDREGRSLSQQFRQWAGIVGPVSAAIVGSAIFNAEDPAEAARQIVAIRDESTT
ncbi:MAG: orotidine 5'-phosphate decarboxylase / HUMPS family protein [Desulfomonilaceae bacterium]